ncbi:WYL domain-containing protein [Paenibacillus sp. 2TAB23]|uniref:WYL domain-containing protein n=1 Tax=Paenibacillus sp. 2TAB23 TaxID=3233004 RepID=UPI003F9A6515
MNPFEKIFNYQILSRLEDSGTMIITQHERGWLKLMLEHPAAASAFELDTLHKLRAILTQDPSLDTDGLLHKAASKERHVYHPYVRLIRQAILKNAVLQISYLNKRGEASSSQACFPYKLEYSMVKREWYLLYYQISNRRLMRSKLEKLLGLAEQTCSEALSEQYKASIHTLLSRRSVSADILIEPQYNGELSRILYAFSCFEKEVSYAAEANAYTIRLFFDSSDSEFVLSKTRFLGKRVRIVEGEHLKRRMLESATKALGRYAGSSG